MHQCRVDSRPLRYVLAARAYWFMLMNRHRGRTRHTHRRGPLGWRPSGAKRSMDVRSGIRCTYHHRRQQLFTSRTPELLSLGEGS